MFNFSLLLSNALAEGCAFFSASRSSQMLAAHLTKEVEILLIKLKNYLTLTSPVASTIFFLPPVLIQRPAL
jgi:hypothetical protein